MQMFCKFPWDGKRNSSAQYCSISCPGCRKPDVDRAGSDLSSSAVSDIEACVKHCDSLSTCKAWTFRTSDMMCWVKRAVPPETPHTGGLWSAECGQLRTGFIS